MLDALRDREGPTHRKEEERHDEGPEVPLRSPPELEPVTGAAGGESHPDEEERLVAGVGQRVHGLRQGRRGAG